MLLRDDKLNLTRRGPRETTHRRLRYPFFVFVFLSVGLLVLSRINHSALIEVRSHLAEIINPIIEAGMIPFDPVRRAGQRLAEQVDLAEEVERLRRENQKLSGWEWRARQLERRIADLESIAKVVPEQPLPFVTSRVIGESSGAFGQTILIDVGSQHGIARDYPVIDADGLVGRVIHAGRDVSRVLLVTDLNSRVPVRVGKTEYRALLAGDETMSARLLYLPEDAEVLVGDEVSTSGVGGGFPRGLRIGSVARVGGVLKVKLRAKITHLEHVSVLRFDAVNSLPSGAQQSGQSPVPEANRKSSSLAGGSPADDDVR